MTLEDRQRGERIATHLRHISRAAYRWVLAHGGKQATTLPQAHLIVHVLRQPGLTLREASGLMGLANSTVSGIVDRLERDGLLRREPNPDDRRSVRIYPTERTGRLKIQVVQLVHDYFAKLLSNLTPPEAAALEETLAKLSRAAEAGAGEGGRSAGRRA